jgi:hypothetical protein
MPTVWARAAGVGMRADNRLAGAGRRRGVSGMSIRLS